MDRILSILDTNDLTSVDAVAAFFRKRSLSDVMSLAEGLSEAIREASRSIIQQRTKPTIDQANFLPSSSMRGNWSCLHWECRARKVELLARYVALYCDKALVPIAIEPADIHKYSEIDEALERSKLAAKISEIVTLRPLIEQRLIELVPEELHFCKEHWKLAVPRHHEIIKAAEALARKHSAEFGFTYEAKAIQDYTIPALTVTGPEEFIEHGSITKILAQPPVWARGRGRAKFAVSPTIVRRHKLLMQLFWPLVNDAFIQNYFGLALNARYVTDLPFEGEFLKAISARDELSRQTAALCARLTHTIPMLEGVPIKSVLKIRKMEPEAFENYRSALTGIVRDYVRRGSSIRDEDAREIYLELLKPQLDTLKAQASNVRRAQLKRSAVKIVASSALVGLGVYSGVLSTHLVDVVKTIGGFSVAKDLAETLGAIQKNPTEIRNNNLYFILKLQQRRPSR